jgi:hypothetical protein
MIRVASIAGEERLPRAPHPRAAHDHVSTCRSARGAAFAGPTRECRILAKEGGKLTQ